MDDVLCRKCNRCLTHCPCSDADIEIPYPEQLVIAKYEWGLMGVRI
jgi:epoxyqueuosine reductase QueG